MVQPAHTAHACRFCRQKRSKCDGNHPCDRCQRWEQTCIYDNRAKETKGDLRRERDELLSRSRDASAIFEALQSDDLATETMASLWSRTPLDRIASQLGEPSQSTRRASASQAAPYETIALKQEDPESHQPGNVSASSPTRNSPFESPPSAIGDASKRHRRDTFTLQSPGTATNFELDLPRKQNILKEPWKIVGVDVAKVKSLLDVFFDRQYLPLLCINREALERDFLEGGQKTCSRALIRIILCLACRSIDGYDAPSSHHVNLSWRFVYEAATILGDPEEITKSLPDAQAYGLLALDDLGTSRYYEAIAHVESCVGMLLALHNEEPHEKLDVSTITWSSPLSTCLQGSVALARTVHLLFRSFHPPSTLENKPKSKATNWLSPEINENNEEVLKVLSTPTTLGPVHDQDRFSALFVTLTSSVYCFLSTLQMPVVEFPTDLLHVYHSCLSQYSGLIVALRSLETSRTIIPFIHLVYHFSLLSLCRPFSHIPGNADTPIDFRAICLEAAQAILSLSTSYYEMIATRRLPVFVPLFAYAAGLACDELALTEQITFQPPPIPHDFSTESSRETRSDITAFDASSGSTPASSTCTGLSVSSKQGDKRKINQISVSPLATPVSTQAGGELSKAVECLGMMGDVFPMAREAEQHLKGLMSRSTAYTIAQKPDYGFPPAQV